MTIVVVNYNTLEYLQVLVHAVRQYSPSDVRIIVVDNASTDGSRTWLSSRSDIRTLHMPVNLHHGPAMDVGVLHVRTEFFVALDVDAFPISSTWLDSALSPLRDGAHVAGAGWQPDFETPEPYVHACFLSMRTKRFAEMEHTFTIGPTWDTGERITQRERPHVGLLPPTHTRGPGAVGTVFGDVVYHNFYSARFRDVASDRIDWVNRGDPEKAWTEAIQRYFPGMRSDDGPTSRSSHNTVQLELQ